MKRTKRIRTKRTRTTKQVENRKKIFTFLEKLVVGAVKVWFNYKGVSTKFIVAADDAGKITQEYIDSLE